MMSTLVKWGTGSVTWLGLYFYRKNPLLLPYLPEEAVMDYRAYGQNSDGSKTKDRRSRKFDRSIAFRENKALHSSSGKKKSKDESKDK
jgi:hypothetical protein